MNKVNKNIELQGELLATIKSNQLIRGMDAFVEASKRFGEITGSLDQFERARRLMLIAAQETINLQKDFNESLQVPKQVAAEINSILDRITKFEANINGLGENIAHTQMVGSALVEQIKENISAIRSKQKVAENYSDTASKNWRYISRSRKRRWDVLCRSIMKPLILILMITRKCFRNERKNWNSVNVSLLRL